MEEEKARIGKMHCGMGHLLKIKFGAALGRSPDLKVLEITSRILVSTADIFPDLVTFL